MTKQNLLDALCGFTREAVKDLLFPVELQEDDEAQPPPRAPEVYSMGLPEFAEAEKKAPLIIHQVITANDVWPEGRAEPDSKAVVRTVFGIYHPDSPEGPQAMFGLKERVRQSLLRQRLIGKQLRLDNKGNADHMAAALGKIGGNLWQARLQQHPQRRPRRSPLRGPTLRPERVTKSTAT